MACVVVFGRQALMAGPGGGIVFAGQQTSGAGNGLGNGREYIGNLI